MLRFKNFLLTITAAFILFKGSAQVFPPPSNLQFNTFTLVANWEPPRRVLLDEDFEDASFPPAGWVVTSGNSTGWYTSSEGSSQYFIIPGHTTYAMVNDDTAGISSNGCCDYLITPALDLTVCDGFKLTFDSYFNGNNGQKASVEMSTDNGITWSLVKEMVHYPTWETVEVDLSAWSGTGGLSSVQFAFHADDQGNQASGWAVDNVVIQSDSLGVTGYTLLLDQNPLATITETLYVIPPGMVTYGGSYTFCVRANYPTGFADTCVPFTSYYLPPPANLSAASSDSGVWFTWQTPVSVSEVISYNIYSDGNIIANVPVSVTTWFAEQEFGEACIEVTAIHNISIYGYPGMYAESVKATACGFVDTGFDLPFTENWTSGTLAFNHWSSESNWSITGQVGNQAPSVKYEGAKSPGSYSSALTSWHFNSLGYTDCPSGYGSRLSFDVKLNDETSAGTESLIVELLIENGVVELKRYKNEGSFDWLNEDIEITQRVLDNAFQIRFRAEGSEAQNITAWYIDNIQLYNYVSDNWSTNLEVNAQREGTPENDIRVSWQMQGANVVVMDYILDDGSVEYYNGTGDNHLWMGNEFPVSDAGILQKASVFCEDILGTSAHCVIDIFDANGNLLGSSSPFIPATYAFTDVSLPDIPFSGNFYAMFHNVSPGLAMSLGIDANGPNALKGYSWVYDGTTWTNFVDYTSTTGVIALRVSALIGGTGSDTANPCDIVGYNIYRKEYSSFPAGPNQQGSGDYHWIGSVPFGTNEFLDRDVSNIDNNCFEYGLTIQYIEGEGSESGSAWSCIYVGGKELQKDEVKIYPNPADATVKLDFSTPMKEATLFNSAGQIVFKETITNQTSVLINTSVYPPGVYSLRFINTSGKSSIRRLVVVHQE